MKSKQQALQKHYLSLNEGSIILYEGDCVQLLKSIPEKSVSLAISSPPYCIGKEYESIYDDVNSFRKNHKKVLPLIIKSLKPGGSICWQIGYHVKNGEIIPLDYEVHDIITSINKHLSDEEKMILRNRIVWTFGHGLNSDRRLSGRHEIILWYTKGNDYVFNLDSIRVPQKYPGKTYYKGEKKGQPSGNPKGKNPSDVWKLLDDVWDIPNVKANHIEKTAHPCQFPVALPQRLIKALSNEGDVVLDPFLGSGTTAVASILEGRRFVGAELSHDYIEIARNRIEQAIAGDLKYRDDKPVVEPNVNSKVAQKPENFLW